MTKIVHPAEMSACSVISRNHSGIATGGKRNPAYWRRLQRWTKMQANRKAFYNCSTLALLLLVEMILYCFKQVIKFQGLSVKNWRFYQLASGDSSELCINCSRNGPRIHSGSLGASAKQSNAAAKRPMAPGSCLAVHARFKRQISKQQPKEAVQHINHQTIRRLEYINDSWFGSWKAAKNNHSCWLPGFKKSAE